MTSAILLDTHALIWIVRGEPRFGPGTRSAIDEAWSSARVLVSAFTFWEIAMLARKRRLDLSVPTHEWRRQVLSVGLSELPVTGDIAIRAESLDGFHGDPADRIIVATAAHHDLTLITADDAVLGWPGSLARMDLRK